MNENANSELVSVESESSSSSSHNVISPYKTCIILPYDDAMSKSKEILNFREILQLFNCAISQEQAWSVLYQLLVEFKYLLETDLDLVKANSDQIDIDVLHFTKEGVILFKFKNIAAPPSVDPVLNEQERQLVESRALKSIAYLIFDALDYGNNYSNEPVLQSSLSHLLLLISGHFKEFNNKTQSEDDEGYEQEEEDSICLEKAIEICINNVPEAADHYRAVCRGLFAQAYELKVFLAKIEDSKNVLQKAGKDTTTHYCFELLNKTDWAKLWMQVIHELRDGVKLRKVCEKPFEIRRHIEYELTPFEILLDQIRARKYHLRKVSLDTSLAPQVKKDARDIILEFIRSRPPLKKSSLRKLNASVKFKPGQHNQTVNLHEQLMNSIRNHAVPLRKTTINKWKNSEVKDSDNSRSDSIKEPKRLLKVDKKLLNNLQSSDDEDSDIDYDDLKNLPILPEDESLEMSNIATFNSLLMNMTSYSANSSMRKKRIKAPESLRSPLTPIWIEPIETWRALVTEDVLTDNNSKQDSSMKRNQTMHLADLSSLSNNLASLNIFSGLRLLNRSTTNEQQQQQSANDETRIYDSKKKLNENPQCLKLTFEELCHIRNVLTKAELDYLLFDSHLFNDVARGRVCFSCRKTKFNLFNWGYKCQICQQKICKKCLRNAQIHNGQIAQVPLSKLGPNSKQDEKSRPHERLYSTSQVINKSRPMHKHVDPDSFSCVSIDKTDTSSLNEFTRPSSSPSSKRPSQVMKIMEICVDCYQIIDGVDVSTSLDDLTFGEEVKEQEEVRVKPIPRRSNTLASHDLLKSAHLNNLKQQAVIMNSDSSSSSDMTKTNGSNTPDMMIMNSLSDFEIINSGEAISPPHMYPKNKKRLSHHSTPTVMMSPLPTSQLDKHDVSDINANQLNDYEQLSSSTSSSKSCSSDHFPPTSVIEDPTPVKSSLRDGLTLDLKHNY